MRVRINMYYKLMLRLCQKSEANAKKATLKAKGVMMLAMDVKKETRRIDHKERVIKLCFDQDSIVKFKPGLKLLYAAENEPLFVNLRNLKVDKLQHKTL